VTSWIRTLPLRGKVIVTVAGALVAVLGASTFLSFRYWRQEYIAASQEQALLAAQSTRAVLEPGLTGSRHEVARANLRRLVEGSSITAARVFGPDDLIILSAERAEEGTSAGPLWIPDPGDLPRAGVVRPSDDGKTVRAFMPMRVPGGGVLEVEFSVEAVKSAMERGARLGLGLMLGSIAVLMALVVAMLEREVVAPLQRVGHLLTGPEADNGALPGDEVHQIEASVVQLIERERDAELRAAAKDERMAQTEGLAQVGELAAEMAHEFKRPLASIQTAIGMLEQEYVLEDSGREVLEAVDGQLERLSETMQDLFSLAKPMAPTLEPFCLQAAADEALLELAGTPGLDGITVLREYPDEDVEIQGDARRLRQALFNLLVNGAEAMPAGGELTLGIESIADEHVDVFVRDTGTGIPPEEVADALRPFYSTKPLGTGLGLPLVVRVVRAHKGRLKVTSMPGRGTTVHLTLPRATRALVGKEG